MPRGVVDSIYLSSVSLCVSLTRVTIVQSNPRESSLRDFLGCVRGRSKRDEESKQTRVAFLTCLDPRAGGPDRDRLPGVATTVLISA